MADDTVIYSKRYPQEREKIRALWDQFKESEGGKEETERKLREFWEKMETESVYIPVSYTHLDVYKRQLQDRSWTASRFLCQCS